MQNTIQRILRRAVHHFILSLCTNKMTLSWCETINFWTSKHEMHTRYNIKAPIRLSNLIRICFGHSASMICSRTDGRTNRGTHFRLFQRYSDLKKTVSLMYIAHCSNVPKKIPSQSHLWYCNGTNATTCKSCSTKTRHGCVIFSKLNFTKYYAASCSTELQPDCQI